jgi:O-antigen/teichoic acid export membrane protein
LAGAAQAPATPSWRARNAWKLVLGSRFRLGAVATLGTDTLGRGLGLFATVLFIRFLDVPGYAYIVLFLAVGQFVGSSATGGIAMKYLRTEAECVSRGVDSELSFPSALLGGTLVIAGLAVLGLASAAVLASVSGRGGWGAAAFIGLCALFAVAQGAVSLAMFERQAHLAFISAGAINIARSVVLVLSALCVGLGLWHSALTTAAAMTLSTSAVALCACWRPTLAAGAADFRATRFGFGAESAWLTVFYVASAGFATVDVFIVAALLGHRDVAAFGAAQRYYAFALGAAPALTAVLRVRTAQRDMIDSVAPQARMLRSWVRKTGIPVVLLMAALAALAPLAIPVADGGKYPTSIPVLQLLLVGVCAYYVLMPAPSLLMAQKRYRALALAVFGAFVGNALGDYVAVAGLGLGIVAIAAVASAASVGFYLATVLLVMQKW